MDRLSRFEVYSNTGDVSSFDHYVPQLLLRRFKTAKSGERKPRIFQYDYQTNLVEDRYIKKVAGEIGYDTIKDKTGTLSDYVSKRLYAETLELRGSYVIKLINETIGDPSITFLEESTLAAFLAFQLTRVPAFHSAIEKFILYLNETNNLAKHDLGNRDFLESVIVNNSLGITLEQLQNHKPTHSLKGGRNQISALTLLIGNAIAENIYRGYLHIVDIPKGSDEKFVISDNPIVLLDFERYEILQFPAWWEINKGSIWIFMPISPYRCILYCKSRKKDNRVEDDNMDLVQLINFGQYLNASRYVYSSDETIIKSHIKMYAKELLRQRI